MSAVATRGRGIAGPALKLVDLWSQSPQILAVVFRWVFNPAAFRDLRAQNLRPLQHQRETGALIKGVVVRAVIAAILAVPAVYLVAAILATAGALWWPVALGMAAGAGWAATKLHRRHSPAEVEPVEAADPASEAGLADVLAKCVGGVQKRIDADPTALRVGKYQRDYDAQARHSTVDLPTGITAKDLRDNLDAIADGLRVWPDQVTIEQAAPGKVRIWVADQRPGDRDVPPWELHGATGWNMATDPLPIGITTKGARATLDLHSIVRGRKIAGGSLLVGGATGSGKTTFIRQLVCAAALDPHATIALFDGKGEGDYAELEPVCDWYRVGVEPADLAALKVMLEQAAGHMAARAKGRQAKHPLLIVLDEIQRVKDKATLALIEDLVRVGRSAGIFVVIATQKPSGQSLPTDLRDNVRTRLCFRVGNQETNDMILGTGAYKSGLNARELRGFGSGILIAADGSDIRVRTADVTEDQADRIAKTHRREPGQLFAIDGQAVEGFPTYPADVETDVQDPEPADEPDQLLIDVRAAFPEGQDRALCNDLATRLAPIRPEFAPEFDGDDEPAMIRARSKAAAKLSAALKDSGVEATKMRVGKATGVGVFREQVERALNGPGKGVSGILAEQPEHGTP